MNHILIADDNTVFSNALASYLRSQLADYTVQTVEDGAKAIEALNARPVSLLLTDLNMPNVNGYQVIAYARTRHPRMQVVAMTSAWLPDAELLLQKSGVERCIAKPLRQEDIDRMIIGPLRDREKTGAMRTAE